MSGGIKSKLSNLMKAIVGAAKGIEVHSSQIYTSTLDTDIYTEKRDIWMEAAPAHPLCGGDTFTLAKYTRTNVVVNAASPVTLTTFEKEVQRNIDGSPALHTRETALNELGKFEQNMETLCDLAPKEDSVNYKRTMPPTTLPAAPAISMF